MGHNVSMSRKNQNNDYPRKMVFLLVAVLLIVLAYFLGVSRERSRQLKVNSTDDNQSTLQLEKQIKSLKDELDNTKSSKTSN